jgi:molybdopterin-guanine dinucleotide biosynthesis protein A
VLISFEFQVFVFQVKSLAKLETRNSQLYSEWQKSVTWERRHLCLHERSRERELLSLLAASLRAGMPALPGDSLSLTAINLIMIEGFILAGGASSRMGTDKAQLDLGGQTFIARIAAALASIAVRTSVVGAQGTAGASELPFVPDVYAKWGALGGLHAALAACRAEWAAVVACDLPFVTGELFVRLASLRENFDAVVPVQSDGRLQPLCALYRVEPCRKRAEELIAAGEHRPRALLLAVKTRWVEMAELEDIEGAPLFFTNVNTPEDYLKARKAVTSNK